MSEHTADAGPAIDIGALIDGQRIGRPAILFLVIATAAMIADGFDIAAMGYVVPELVKSWHIAPAAAVPALSAGVFGLLFGAPIFGFVGDRFGRRYAILAALGIVGLFSLITATATSLNEFVVLRFVTGVGLGGLIPNIIALAAEIAPKRARGTFIIIVNFGVPAGFVIPGWVAALFVPHYGWPALMIVGGVLPLAICALAYVYLQESLGFLMQRGGREDDVHRIVVAMRPDATIASGTRFTMPASAPVLGKPGSPAKLFTGGLAFITPLLWIALAANQFTNFFTLSWLPTLLQSSGMSTAQAGMSASFWSIGGIVGGLILTFIIDRLGGLPTVVFFLLGAPLVAAIGIPHLSPAFTIALIAGAGLCVTGNNFGTNAVVGMIYPTAVRSMGTGWAQACGRLGSLAAQIVGGLLLAQHLTMQEMYLAPALMLLVGAVAAALVVIFCHKRFRSFRLDDSKSLAVAEARGAPAEVPLDTQRSIV